MSRQRHRAVASQENFGFLEEAAKSSPRLAWFQNHDVHTHRFVEDPKRQETYNHLGFGTWVAYVGKRIPPHEDSRRIWACADTEDDAVIQLATTMGWLLWNEEPAAALPLNSKAEKSLRPVTL